MSFRRRDPLAESPTEYVGDDVFTSVRRILFYQLPLVVAALWSLQTNRIWPVLPLGFGLALLTVLFDRYSLNEQSVVLAAIISGVGYRATVAVATPSLIGGDPDNHVVAILRINEMGTISAISPLIYENIPLFFIYHSVTAQLTGVHPEVSLSLVALVLYTVIPVLAVASILRRVSETNTVKMGIILTTAGSIFLSFSELPITQAFMTLFWFVLMITLFDLEDDVRFVLSCVLIFFMTLSHKLGPLLPLLLSSCIVVFSLFQSWRRNEFSIPRRAIGLVGFSSVMFVFQGFFLTGYGQVVIQKFTVFSTQSSSPGLDLQSDLTIVSFVEPKTGITPLLFEHASWVVLIPLAGLCGAWLLYAKTDDQSTKILAIALTSVLFVVVAITSKFTLAGIRARILGGPIYMVLVAIGVSRLIGQGERPPIGTAVILLLLVTQLGAAGAAPDHPAENREYLSEPEIDGKEHANTYIDSTRYAPAIVAREPGDFSRPGLTHRTGAAHNHEGWQKVDIYVLFDELPEEGCIVWRKDLRYLRVGELWRITGDPTPIFEEDRSRVYENRDMVIYC